MSKRRHRRTRGPSFAPPPGPRMFPGSASGDGGRQQPAPAPAARLPAELTRMLATARNDITVPGYGTVMRTQDETVLDRGGARGIRLYDEVRRDGQALAVLTKRIGRVLARPWEVTPASDAPRDQAAAELVREVLTGMAFDDLCRGLLWALLYGYSVAEIEWGRGAGRVVPARVVVHERARFVFDPDWQPRLLTLESAAEGIELPARKFLVHRHEPEGSDPYGRGLGRVLYWHVLFKRDGVGFWLHALEKFASPTPVAKYPFGTPPAEQDRLLDTLVALVQRGALAVPIGTEVDFLQAGSGAGDHEAWCRYWDAQTSIAVLGETLSTDLQGSGARAAAEIHAEVSERITDGDADMLSATLKASLVQWIVDFNMPGAGVPDIWRPRPTNESAEEDARAKKASRVRAELNNLFDLARRGYRPQDGLEHALSEIWGQPVVADQALAVRAGTAAAEDPRARAAGSTALTAFAGARTPDVSGVRLREWEPATAGAHDHGMGDLVDQLDAAARPALDDWIALIRAELERMAAAGEPLDQVPRRLLALYPQLEGDDLASVLADALILADLTGRADVLDEVGEA